MMKKFCALALLMFAPLAHATPISYTLDFNVQFLNWVNDPDVQVGKTYPGFFTVDDALLATDGLNKPGVLSAFFIQMEDVVWDLLSPSDFRGFRGPDGLGSSSPGFDVLGGEIVNLRGGVYGEADVPFVDFTFIGVPNTFSTINESGSWSGSMNVRRVPEPGTLLLMGIGLLGLAGWRLRAAAGGGSLSSTRRG
jgi:hypothetical protein